jgi:inner membrane protein
MLAARGHSPRLRWMVGLATLSLAPDLDVIGFRFGIRYAEPFGHRGATHSLLVAALGGLLVAFLARETTPRRASFALVCAVLLASHGLLDTLTDGGLGVALLWPFSNERYFAPWRPIPVAPIGGRMFSARGLRVLAIETLQFIPIFSIALWPRRNRSTDPP